MERLYLLWLFTATLQCQRVAGTVAAHLPDVYREARGEVVEVDPAGEATLQPTRSASLMRRERQAGPPGVSFVEADAGEEDDGEADYEEEVEDADAKDEKELEDAGQQVELDEEASAVVEASESRPKEENNAASPLLEQEEEAERQEADDERQEEDVDMDSEFNASATASGKLRLINGWKNYGRAWLPATWTLRHGFCFVTGLVKGSRWGSIATVPRQCRPTKRLIFSCNNHDKQARCEVRRNGWISWIAGGKSYGWLSLSGIVFATRAVPRAPLPMADGWKAYGSVWGSPSYTVSKGLCLLEGLAKAPKWTKKKPWDKIAQLPLDCMPNKNLVFKVNNHDLTARLDVTHDGEVFWRAGGHNHGWLSLAGVLFAVDTYVGTQSTLLMQNGWKDYDLGGTRTAQQFGGVTFSRVGGVCLLEGVALSGQKKFNNNDIGWLPEECRPKGRLIFGQNRHEYTSRVDVSKNGKVRFIKGGKTRDWVSLSGIAFDVNIPDFRGPKGPQGVIGVRGYTGVQGFTGGKGATGAVGDQGLQGRRGDDGAPGYNGTVGEIGKHGIIGHDGERGPTGDAGKDGPQGETGPPGPTLEAWSAVNCVWMDWFDWEACDKACGSGRKLRRRMLQVAPRNGGECKGMDLEEKECEVKACPNEAGANVSNASSTSASNTSASSTNESSTNASSTNASGSNTSSF